MKKLFYILVPALMIMVSCTSRLYTGAEYDDLYYLPSDKPVTKVVQSPIEEQAASGNLDAQAYYDSADTLVSERYSDANDYDDQIIVNNNYGSGYDYYDYSYAGRLNRFYGNYFYPYWRDPFYYDWYPSFGISYGLGYGFSFGLGYGYPYYYSPYYYSPYYYGWGYGGFYDRYYYGFNDYWYGHHGGYYHDYLYGDSRVPYGRRERPNTLTSRRNYGSSYESGTGSYRRNNNVSGGNAGVTGGTGRRNTGNQAVYSDSRRTVPSTNVQPGGATATNRRQDAVRSNSSIQRNPASTKSEYNSANRTYTPSYSNPRMSTRPSYNNSRTSTGTGNNAAVRSNNSSVNTRSNNNAGIRSYQNSGNSQRGNSYINSGQRRSVSSSYSTPERRSMNSGQNSYSRPSSSFNSGSSSSRSSFSSGSSSGSSSRSSSGGGSSNHQGGRR